MKKTKVIKLKTLELKKVTVANLGADEMIHLLGGMVGDEPVTALSGDGDGDTGEAVSRGCIKNNQETIINDSNANTNFPCIG